MTTAAIKLVVIGTFIFAASVVLQGCESCEYVGECSDAKIVKTCGKSDTEPGTIDYDATNSGECEKRCSPHGFKFNLFGDDASCSCQSPSFGECSQLLNGGEACDRPLWEEFHCRVERDATGEIVPMAPTCAGTDWCREQCPVSTNSTYQLNEVEGCTPPGPCAAADANFEATCTCASQDNITVVFFARVNTYPAYFVTQTSCDQATQAGVNSSFCCPDAVYFTERLPSEMQNVPSPVELYEEVNYPSAFSHVGITMMVAGLASVLGALALLRQSRRNGQGQLISSLEQPDEELE